MTYIHSSPAFAPLGFIIIDRELCSYFYIDMTLFKMMLRRNGETKEVK